MKMYSLIATLLFGTFSISQNNDPALQKMYYKSLENHFKQIKEYIDEGIVTYGLEDLYITSEFVPTELIPEVIGDTKVNYINVNDRKNNRVLRKGIRAISIKPIKLNDNQIEIHLIEYLIILNKNVIEFSRGSGSITTFEYDCYTNKWTLIGTNF